MNHKEKQLFIKLNNELQLERNCADLLADALIQGGLDRQFEALNNHELLRNGINYPKHRSNHPSTRQKDNHDKQ
jgi:hypothetical protein